MPFCSWKNVINTAITDSSAALLFLGLAALITVFPYIIYTYGLKTVPASEASVIACVEPLVAALVGLAFYGQTMNTTGLIGMGLILTSVIILSYKK